MHHIMHCFLFKACVSFTSFFFVLVFIDLTLFVLFLSVFKNSKTHKNLKNLQKV